MKLYMKYFKMHLQSSLEYKMSFFLTTLGQFLVSFHVFLGVYFMFIRFSTLKGYTFSQVLLTFSVVLMQFSIAECFARGFDTFSGIISNGEFDRIMVRPRNVVLQVLGSRIEFTRLGRLTQATLMLLYGVNKSGVEWSVSKILCLLFMILGGSILFSCIFLLNATLCFFTTEGLEFVNVLTDGAREHGKYPFDIYGKKVLSFCTFIIPYALVQYYPLKYVFGTVTNWRYLFLPLLACLFIIPTYLFWKVGIRHYKSTGS